MRETFTERGGVEIDTQGDAFFFAFPRARDAVEAAVEAQRAHAAHEWPDGCAVHVRMGLHTGEPAVGSEGYLGLDVVRAARLCTAGKGGHVLLSDTTRALVGASLPDGVSIFPLGERRLKDIDEPERVFELEIEGAAPPLPAEGDERISVPAPPPPPAAPAPPGDDFGDRLAERITASVRRGVGAVARAGGVPGRHARRTRGETARDDHRAARGGRSGLAEYFAHAAQASPEERPRARGVERAVQRPGLRSTRRADRAAARSARRTRRARRRRLRRRAAGR